MSGLAAANVSAFAAIWTEDIYRSRIVRHAAGPATTCWSAASRQLYGHRH